MSYLFLPDNVTILFWIIINGTTKYFFLIMRFPHVPFSVITDFKGNTIY